ncbi:MAG: hypothetical protein Q9M43_12585 [Sulfurimonas sp.]|nr:hypothetical protein [Sulfurimonas sp.]
MLSLANPKIYNQEKLWITPLDTVKFLYKYNLIENTQLFPSNTWLVKMLEDTKSEVNTTKNLDKMIFDISKYKSPSKIPNERQFQSGYTKRNDKDYLKLSFLPASHGLNDYNREDFGESELKIGYLSVLVNDENIELDEFTLYGMKLYMPYSSSTHDLSYQFELAVKKEYTQNMEYLDTRLLLKQSITNPFQSLYLRVLNQG